MKMLLIYHSDLDICYVFVFVFLHFFISSKSDFHNDAERMIVQTQEM